MLQKKETHQHNLYFNFNKMIT
jgi:hypothetical protein